MYQHDHEGLDLERSDDPIAWLRYWLRYWKRTWIALSIGAFVCFASCVRFDLFASSNDPPSLKWKRHGNLVNKPVVMTPVRMGDELEVTIANQGETTLRYRSEFGTQPQDKERWIETCSELEEKGSWCPLPYEPCCVGRTFDLHPRSKVVLHTRFRHSRRERILARFIEMEDAGFREDLVVVACEGPRLTFDSHQAILPASAALSAFGIWMTVRVVNRRTA